MTAWKVHPVVMVVVDVEAARRLVAAGAMRCPDAGCPGTLRPWSRATVRTVTVRGGLPVRLRPYRVCCRACTVTHVLLPAGCLPRRAYDVETIGTALTAAAAGAGSRRAAVAVAAPRSTVRTWLRAVRDQVSALTATAVAWARDLGGDPADGVLPLVPAPDPIAAVLAALGAAAATVAAGPCQVTSRPGPVTGVDYLTLLHDQFQQQVWQRLHQGRPDMLATARPWQQVNVLTGGRLLTAAQLTAPQLPGSRPRGTATPGCCRRGTRRPSRGFRPSHIRMDLAGTGSSKDRMTAAWPCGVTLPTTTSPCRPCELLVGTLNDATSAR